MDGARYRDRGHGGRGMVQGGRGAVESVMAEGALRVEGDVEDAADPKGEVVVAKTLAVAVDIARRGVLPKVVVAGLEDEWDRR